MKKYNFIGKVSGHMTMHASSAENHISSEYLMSWGKNKTIKFLQYIEDMRLTDY